MKNISIKAIVGTLFASMFLTGCSGILDEQPRSTYDPTFFKTEKGVMGGLTALYGHLRYIYGQGYYLNACETGTDEYTYGWSADGNYKNADLSGVGELTPSTCRADVLWNQAFPTINTASGIIENGTEAGVNNALIAEARFFRAFDYFLLVQTFGGVPLDLGAGELKFNISPTRSSVRNTVPEVYTKAVFPDLLLAVENLPEAGRVTGGATKTLARLFLSKAYLTYGWWLENSNNIPTYPECQRVDPDGHDAQWYFQQAYDVATQAIDNPGSFKLMDTYYNLNVGSNDRNTECLLYADHTESSEFYDDSSHSYNTGSSPGNFAVWMVTMNYTLLRSSLSGKWDDAFESVKREASQAYGRPWSCMAPTVNAIKNTFADKVNDSRYDGTFVTTFRANWTKDPGSKSKEFVYNANNMKVYPGEAILTFLDEQPDVAIDYSNSVYKSNLGVGVLPGRADYVVGPNEISRFRYPNLWKLGTYRTDSGDGLGQPNGSITRPFTAAKFSELYFIAAEAAVKGATIKTGKSARELVNVIRARAGKWSWSNNENTEKIADHSTEMMTLTPAIIDINYILSERSREYFGEGYRWQDLVRTQKWTELSSVYAIGAAVTNSQDHKVVTFQRTIEPYMYLRPIPQGQLDGMEMSAAEKTAYQNPGYK